MPEFEREFEDLCEDLNGKLVKNSYLAEVVCVLKGAVLYGYSPETSPSGKPTVILRKKGLDTLVVEGFEGTVRESKCLNTGLLKTRTGLKPPIRKLGEHIGCFEAEVDGANAKICLNENGDIVYASLLPE